MAKEIEKLKDMIGIIEIELNSRIYLFIITFKLKNYLFLFFVDRPEKIEVHKLSDDVKEVVKQLKIADIKNEKGNRNNYSPF